MHFPGKKKMVGFNYWCPYQNAEPVATTQPKVELWEPHMKLVGSQRGVPKGVQAPQSHMKLVGSQGRSKGLKAPHMKLVGSQRGVPKWVKDQHMKLEGSQGCTKGGRHTHETFWQPEGRAKGGKGPTHETCWQPEWRPKRGIERNSKMGDKLNP